MPQDVRVTSAIAHWAPRFVANGVSLTDFEEVTTSISAWDAWCQAWSARAALHEELGRDALDRGKLLSAGEHLQRAGVYYHFGKFLFVHDVPQMKAAHAKAVACRAIRRSSSSSSAASPVDPVTTMPAQPAFKCARTLSANARIASCPSPASNGVVTGANIPFNSETMARN